MPYLWPICDSSSSYYFNLNAYFTCFPFVFLVIEPICQNKRGKISCKQGTICFHVCLLCHPTFILPWIWHCFVLRIKGDDQVFLSPVLSMLLPLFPVPSVILWTIRTKPAGDFEDWLGMDLISFHAFHFHTQIILEFQGDAFIPHSFEELLYFNTCEI